VFADRLPYVLTVEQVQGRDEELAGFLLLFSAGFRRVETRGRRPASTCES
jgi:hypothetical protein